MSALSSPRPSASLPPASLPPAAPATLVIDGHPNPDSLCAALARSYVAGDPQARLLAVRDLDFDVHMRYGYARRMAIEPDLAQARAAIRDARHIVVVTPVWWRSIPALLKGFLDRALLPGEDFRYGKNGLPEGLLAGRSARVIATADTPLWLQPLLPDTRLRSLSKGTLAFCGLKPVSHTRFAPVKDATPEQRAGWLSEVEQLAAREARRLASASASAGASVRAGARVRASDSAGAKVGAVA